MRSAQRCRYGHRLWSPENAFMWFTCMGVHMCCAVLCCTAQPGHEAMTKKPMVNSSSESLAPLSLSPWGHTDGQSRHVLESPVKKGPLSKATHSPWERWRGWLARHQITLGQQRVWRPPPKGMEQRGMSHSDCPANMPIILSANRLVNSCQLQPTLTFQ